MPKKKYPSAEHLRQCLRYDNGKLFWLKRPLEHFANKKAWTIWNTKFSGKEAGYVRRVEGRDRVLVGIKTIQYYRHILIWIMHKDAAPVTELDHENRDKMDDRIENLREATTSENACNRKRRSDNISGEKGVSWAGPSKKWRAKIYKDGKGIHLGFFDDVASAKAAYEEAAQVHHGVFACSG
jgi:hypothetical protein